MHTEAGGCRNGKLAWGGRRSPGQTALASSRRPCTGHSTLHEYLLARLVTKIMSSLSALLSWPGEGEDRRAAISLESSSEEPKQARPYFSKLPAYLLTYSFPVLCYELTYFIFFTILNTFSSQLVLLFSRSLFSPPWNMLANLCIFLICSPLYTQRNAEQM